MVLASLRSLRSLRAVQRASMMFNTEGPVLRGWLRNGARVMLLIPATRVMAWVLTLLLPPIFARAFGADAVSPDALMIGVFALFSLLRALFAFRLIEAEHPGTSIGTWACASVACDLLLQLGMPALLPLTPLGGQLGDATIHTLCRIGGGAFTASLQWLLFAPRARWSWLWVIGAIIGWLGGTI
jgi:hypothetical protein